MLILISMFMLFFMLGHRTVWSQETRWVAIVHQMMTSGNFLQPFLDGDIYYDKPLLSYWFVVLASHLCGGLNSIALRLPSALAGAVTLWSTYQLGKKIIDQRTARLTVWLLLSTFYFLFWARTASANMLNLAGIMLALACYFCYRDAPSWRAYCLFFLILSLSALCKGLLAPVIIVLALLPDLIKRQSWYQYRPGQLILAILPALMLYFLPFLLSMLVAPTSHTSLHENGLYQVFHENIVRYFRPFDNIHPIYIYCLYLPIYTLPWAPFLLLALIQLPSRWSTLPSERRWLYWASLIIFVFLTLGGSRRSYYVLPLVPLALLITAEWLQWRERVKQQAPIWRRGLLTLGMIICATAFFIVYPLVDRDGGPPLLANNIIAQAEKSYPWQQWNIVMLSTNDEAILYLHSTHPIRYAPLPPKVNNWPTFMKTLNIDPARTVVIVAQHDLIRLPPFPSTYRVMTAKPSLGNRLLGKQSREQNVAFIVNK